MTDTEAKLISLIHRALFLADAQGRLNTGIFLNEALVTLDGTGATPHAACWQKRPNVASVRVW